MTEPAIAFRVDQHDPPAVEIRVNFGVLTGREVTPAEIDDLARALRRLASGFEIVAEQRHEFGGGLEASVHQVVIEIPTEPDAYDVIAIAEQWARACYDARHIEL
jgi:hypothetical protein